LIGNDYDRKPHLVSYSNQVQSKNGSVKSKETVTERKNYHENTESITGSNTSNYTQVDRHFLPVSKHVDKEWVTAYYQQKGRRFTSEQLEDRVKELLEIRREVCSFARKRVHLYFVEAFIEEGIDHIISMDDMKRWWREHCNTERGKRIMYHVQYGYFEVRSDWEVVLEGKFMEEKRMKYGDGDDREKNMKGCIARIITKEKSEQVKRFQRLRDNIGVSLNKKRKKLEGIQLKRRKKGEYWIGTVKDDAIESDLTGSGEERVPEDKMEKVAREAAIISGLENDIH